jgi:hypothetical protein
MKGLPSSGANLRVVVVTVVRIATGHADVPHGWNLPQPRSLVWREATGFFHDQAQAQQVKYPGMRYVA